MKRYSLIICLCFITSLGYLLWQYHEFYDNRLRVVFCDVGQGDAIIIKTPSGRVLLFDGGPDDSIMNCLSSKLPLWYRTISLMLVSHPHADHFTGFISVLQKYRVRHFGTEKLGSSTPGHKRLMEELDRRAVPKVNLLRGDSFDLGDGAVVHVLEPTRELLERTSPEGSVNDTKEFASLVLLVKYKNFSLLLTGDSQKPELEDAVTAVQGLTVFQVPHHGSATGMDPQIAEKLSPGLAVISVGSKNPYHHPAWQTLEVLKSAHIPVLRTDQHGTIDISTDGKTWRVK